MLNNIKNRFTTFKSSNTKACIIQQNKLILSYTKNCFIYTNKFANLPAKPMYPPPVVVGESELYAGDFSIWQFIKPAPS